MQSDYVVVRRVLAFEPNSPFNAYHYRLFHGRTVAEEQPAIVRHTLGVKPYQRVSLIYNRFGSPEVIQPSIYLIVTDRVKNHLNDVINIDFNEVEIEKVVDIPYGNAGLDDHLVNRLKRIYPDQMLAEAKACYTCSVGPLFELITVPLVDIPVELQSGETKRYYFSRSDKSFEARLSGKVSELFPIFWHESAHFIRRDLWEKIEIYFHEFFFEQAAIEP